MSYGSFCLECALLTLQYSISPFWIILILQKLVPLNDIDIRQVSLQLNCCNTCQLWNWYSTGDQCFAYCEMENEMENGKEWRELVQNPKSMSIMQIFCWLFSRLLTLKELGHFFQTVILFYNKTFMRFGMPESIFQLSLTQYAFEHICWASLIKAALDMICPQNWRHWQVPLVSISFNGTFLSATKCHIILCHVLTFICLKLNNRLYCHYLDCILLTLFTLTG